MYTSVEGEDRRANGNGLCKAQYNAVLITLSILLDMKIFLWAHTLEYKTKSTSENQCKLYTDS